MKKILLSIALALVFVACGKPEDGSSQFVGSWELTEFLIAEDDGEPVPDESMVGTIAYTFNKNGTGRGRSNSDEYDLTWKLLPDMILSIEAEPIVSGDIVRHVGGNLPIIELTATKFVVFGKGKRDTPVNEGEEPPAEKEISVWATFSKV
jgi:hypothetical protein